ncbi:MAG: DNA-3-methyladenine glycosylase 2 family protein [Proteobacteria bacterium]|nr:DNA-3-methyladenine glycosylase 2 family protein [Pseudomonadota bacterium]
MPRLSADSLTDAVAELCAREPRFAPVVARHGVPSLRQEAPGIRALLMTVNDQFLSLAAAAAIWQRVEARLGPCAPATILACPQEELLTLGLSRAKARSFHGIATAAQNGSIDWDSLATLEDEAARKALLALPGVGPWTADIYLLSVELRPDVWPWGDLALQAAAHNLFALPARPGRPGMLALGERFAPFRAVAARLLWSHYRDVRGLKQA